MILVPIVFIGWAATAIATAAVITVALSTLVPLMVLAAGFQAIFALHVNVERIGRYLQAYHERAGDGWEAVAMAFRATGPDPLFGRLFVLATAVNFIPAALGGEPWEIATVATLHLAFIYHARTATGFAQKQRGEDLQQFERIREAGPTEDAGRSGGPERRD